MRILTGWTAINFLQNQLKITIFELLFYTADHRSVKAATFHQQKSLNLLNISAVALSSKLISCVLSAITTTHKSDSRLHLTRLKCTNGNTTDKSTASTTVSDNALQLKWVTGGVGGQSPPQPQDQRFSSWTDQSTLLRSPSTAASTRRVRPPCRLGARFSHILISVSTSALVDLNVDGFFPTASAHMHLYQFSSPDCFYNTCSFLLDWWSLKQYSTSLQPDGNSHHILG